MAVTSILTAGLPAFAQDDDAAAATFDPIECISAAIGLRVKDQNPMAAKKNAVDCASLVDAIERDSPDSIRVHVLDAFLAHESKSSALLRDLNLKPKIIDNGQGDTTLGVNYKFNRDIGLVLKPVYGRSVEGKPPVVMGNKGTAWKLSLSGTVAAEEELNSENFLDSSFAFSMIRETGGAAGAAHLFSEEYAKELDKLDMDAATIEDEEQLMNHPATQELRRIQSMLGSQLYTSLNLRAGLEANQSFTLRNYVYGAQLGLDYKSLSTDSLAARLNILDYPFALVRYLTGYPGADRFAPSGVSFPTFLLGLDQVDPQGDGPRTALGETDTYGRARAEMVFRTPLVQTSKGTYKLTANARYYRELDASGAIEDAGLDESFYFSAAIVAPNGVFVSYRSGELPFDLQSQVVYELGFHTYFK